MGLEKPSEERGPDSRRPSEASIPLQAMGPTCPNTDGPPRTSQTSQSEGVREEGHQEAPRESRRLIHQEPSNSRATGLSEHRAF